MSKIVVAGGNGFIGGEVCRLAVQNGHEVAAFGRTGRPPLTPARHPWTQDVEWRAADVFTPDAWRDLLDGADALVHSIATIREAPERNVTYERVNGESVLHAAQAAEDAGVDGFVFLSVRDTPPLISDRFRAAKRRAERELAEQYGSLRTVILRPNLVYGPRRRGSATLAAVLERLPGGAGGYASAEGRPLPVELVAAAAVHAAVTPSLKGTLSGPQIEDVGRTSGLVDPDALSEPTLTPLLAGLGGAALAAWMLRRWRR